MNNTIFNFDYYKESIKRKVDEYLYNLSMYKNLDGDVEFKLRVIYQHISSLAYLLKKEENNYISYKECGDSRITKLSSIVDSLVDKINSTKDTIQETIQEFDNSLENKINSFYILLNYMNVALKEIEIL